MNNLSKKTKIMQVITGLGDGGAETMLYKLLINLDREAFEPIVVSLGDKDDFYHKKLLSYGVRVHALSTQKNIFSILKSILKYVKIIYIEKPNLVHGWMYHGNFIAFLSKIIFPKIKICFSIRQNLPSIKNEKFLTRCIIKINAFLSQKVDVVFNNSESSQVDHIKIGFSSFNNKLIRNGFDTGIFKPNSQIYTDFRRLHKLDNEVKIVGMIARYHPIKNHAGFLEVASNLIKNFDGQIKFVLAGKDVNKENDILTRQINELNLKDHVILLGRVESYTIMPVLNVYLSTSLNEGFPNVIGEALCCGVPCVVTDVGDCKFIVNRYGIVTDSHNIKELVLSVKAILDKEYFSDKFQQVKYMRSNFSIKQVAQQYESIYRSLILK